MIHAATLSARRVKTAMVPHEVVKVFDTRHSLLENVRNAGEKLHRSYPVSPDGTLERVTGYIRVRELFVQNLTTPETGNWTQLIRPFTVSLSHHRHIGGFDSTSRDVH